MKALVLLLVLPIAVLAQGSSKTDHLNDLNRQMWLPFIHGINTDDAKLYVGIHSEDFQWVAPGSNGRLMNLQQYAEDSIAVMKRRKAEGARSEVEVRFIERNVNSSFAAEKCVMKFTLHREGQLPATSYGVAHYFSRKEDGRWRMFLQYGSTEKASEATFALATPIERIDQFDPQPKP